MNAEEKKHERHYNLDILSICIFFFLIEKQNYYDLTIFEHTSNVVAVKEETEKKNT